MISKQQKRILYYGHFSRGGSSLYIYNLLSSLMSKYDNFHLYSSDEFIKYYKGPISEKTIVITRRKLSKYKYVNKLYTIFEILCGGYKLYKSVISYDSPSIVHVQFPNIFLDYLFFKKLKTNNKLILTAHDVIPHSFTISQTIDMYFIRKTLSVFDRFIVHSETNKQDLMSHFLVNEDKIDVIPHGIENVKVPINDDVLEYRSKYKIPENKKILLFFGSLRDDKGLDVLLDALKGIDKKLYHLIIAGKPMNSTSYNHYLHQIETNRIADNITFMPRFVEDNEIPILYNITNISILPYKWFNSQSGVLATSIAYSIPVIVTDVGGLGELVRENNIGIVVPENNSYVLAQKIEYLINNQNAYERYRNNCICCFRKSSWDVVAEKTLTTYQKLYNES